MIRRAFKVDEPLIKEIHKESVNELGSFNLFQVWTKYLSKSGNYNFLVYEGKAFVRYGYSKKYKSNYIYEIGVLNEFRGQGLGGKLLSVIPRPITLKCNCDNDGGNAFYEKIGMRKLGKVKSKNGKRIMNLWRMV